MTEVHIPAPPAWAMTGSSGPTGVGPDTDVIGPAAEPTTGARLPGSAARASRHLAVELPTGWDHAVHDGPLAVVARPRSWRGRFTPTLTITRSRTPSVTTLVDYCDAQLAGIAATVGGHLVHLATSHRPRAHLDLTLAIEALGVDLTVTQHHLVDPPSPDGTEVRCVSVVATALAADHDWRRLAPVLVTAVRSIRVTGP